MFSKKVGDIVAVQFNMQIKHLESSRRQILTGQVQGTDLRFHCFDKSQGNAASGTTGPRWGLNVCVSQKFIG